MYWTCYATNLALNKCRYFCESTTDGHINVFAIIVWGFFYKKNEILVMSAKRVFSALEQKMLVFVEKIRPAHVTKDLLKVKRGVYRVNA